MSEDKIKNPKEKIKQIFDVMFPFEWQQWNKLNNIQPGSNMLLIKMSTQLHAAVASGFKDSKTNKENFFYKYGQHNHSPEFLSHQALADNLRQL